MSACELIVLFFGRSTIPRNAMERPGRSPRPEAWPREHVGPVVREFAAVAAPALSFDNPRLRKNKLCTWLTLTRPSTASAKKAVCLALTQTGNHSSHPQVQVLDHWIQPLFPRAHAFGRAVYRFPKLFL